jgi:nicotinamide-nucleotide amidase
MTESSHARRLRTAELLSIGTELTVGETRDTNAGELARSLSGLGVRVVRMTALRDDLEAVTQAYADALGRVDLVVSTGGLGPTPDDLTRESIAAACGEALAVDPGIERWLRELWARREMPFPEINLKQAWLIPSATALANPNGTAPGWFVIRPDGRAIVALPGPPREMRPMWTDEALPRLARLGLGDDVVSRTYRLAGIGESQVADILGEPLLRSTNPVVATYARAEAVDVRISAVTERVGGDERDGRAATEALVEATAARVLERLGEYVWATGETTWSEAIGACLAELGWGLGVVEIGTGGSVAALLGDVPWLRRVEILPADAPSESDAVAGDEATRGNDETGGGDATTGAGDRLLEHARVAQRLGRTEVGLAVRARPRAGDTAVSVAVVHPRGEHRERRIVFLGGSNGRARAGLAAAAVLLAELRRSG